MLEVIKPGLLTTVQDKGRWNHLHEGVPISGAMDQEALFWANRLLTQPTDTAVLECTMIGPTLCFHTPTEIAITGGDMAPTLNGQAVELNRSIAVKAGDTLSLGGARSGLRTYIAFKGGILVPEILGSRSTNIIAGFGGFEGRALQKGDLIPIQSYCSNTQGVRKIMMDSLESSSVDTPICLPIIKGPEYRWFAEEAIVDFLKTTYQVTADSNRMGYRLKSQLALAPTLKKELLSSGVVPGTIQVPSSGQPIVLMRDAQTTGGYPRIGVLTEKAINQLSQVRPGEFVRFYLGTF
ncbi:biotin-dependent carboxyltransferase family protein [Algivirga pacifica]|uniref:Biotin-dependent carboxyltransferase family protein n=1 Tax=Algivirga pacifica TaxID=1162670 RepID=A0ABP9D0C9_9BACT